MLEFVLIYVTLGLIIDIVISLFYHINGGKLEVGSTLITVFFWPIVFIMAYREIKQRKSK